MQFFERKILWLQIRLIPFFLLPGLIFLIYSNSLNASWHLDDYQSILKDTHIHLRELTPDSLWYAVDAYLKHPRESRPLSRLTFALNWFFGQQSPIGYHIVNISIHALAAIFLFLTICGLAQSPNLSAFHHRNRYTIALLATVLWATNPIQTQAVTYIVQRMAQLAAMFYVLGLYLYIKGRSSDIPAKRMFFFIGCFLSACCSMASKENGATFPIALLLVEFWFFQDLTQKKERTIFFSITICVALVIAGLCVMLFFNGDPRKLFDYNFRYFTPIERLLTEPRIVLYYLSQIFYPVPTRLSIEHDISLSVSLFSPWTTLPAILLIGTLIGLALYNITKRPVLSFSILFFFLNHVIESTIIGLELIFEHRNYLPSFFLFLPVSIWVSDFLEIHRNKNRFIFNATVVGMVVIVAGFGAGTYIRNFAWQSEKSLWEDAVAKAPNSGRAWHNLALSHYATTGQIEKAMVLYRRALKLEKNNVQQESIILSNMAAVHYHHGDYHQAVKYWRKAIVKHGNNPQIKYLLSLALIHAGDYDTAAAYLNNLVMKYPARFEANNLSGIVALLQGRYHEGLSHFKNGLRLQRPPGSVLINIGAAQSLAGNFIRAEWFFKAYLANRPDAKIALLWLMQNALNQGRSGQADKYLERLHRLATKEDLLLWLSRGVDGKLYRDDTVVPEIALTVRDRLVRQLQRGSSLHPDWHPK